MSSDGLAAVALAELPRELRTQVHVLLAHEYPLEAHRVLTEYLGDALLAKAIVAYMVRRSLGITPLPPA